MTGPGQAAPAGAVDVVVPTLSASDPDSEGVVATWFAHDGETVAPDQLVAEVAVDKVSIEVPSPAAGTIHLLAKEEEVVRAGQVIARID